MFDYPKDETKQFIKRVIGLPGDVIEIRDQVIYLNGTVLSESYIQHTDTYLLLDRSHIKNGPVEPFGSACPITAYAVPRMLTS